MYDDNEGALHHWTRFELLNAFTLYASEHYPLTLDTLDTIQNELRDTLDDFCGHAITFSVETLTDEDWARLDEAARSEELYTRLLTITLGRMANAE